MGARKLKYLWEIAMVLLMTRYKFGFDPMHVRICTKCQVRPYLSYVELYGVESCMEMYCVELYWDVLYWVELYWVVLYWVELYRVVLYWVELYQVVWTLFELCPQKVSSHPHFVSPQSLWIVCPQIVSLTYSLSAKSLSANTLSANSLSANSLSANGVCDI